MDEEQMRQLKPLDMEEVRHMDPTRSTATPSTFLFGSLQLPTQCMGTPDEPTDKTGGSFGMGILCQFGRWGKAQFLAAWLDPLITSWRYAT